MWVELESPGADKEVTAEQESWEMEQLLLAERCFVLSSASPWGEQAQQQGAGLIRREHKSLWYRHTSWFLS